MKRLTFLVSFLALAAAAARADDSATNAPPAADATNGTAAVKSPIMMRGVMASRTPGERGKALRKYSMPEESPSKAQLRAKRWLKSIQLEDGSWPGTPAAATALALLAYYSSLNDGFPDFEGKESREKGVRFLASDVDETGAFRSGDPGGWTIPVGLLALEGNVGTWNERGFAALVRAKRRLLDLQRPSGLWGPEGGPDDFWFTVVSLWALLDSKPFPEDTAAAAERAAEALVRSFEAGALRAPDGTPDAASCAVPHLCYLLRIGRRAPGMDSSEAFLRNVRFEWDFWDSTNRPFRTTSPLRDSLALSFSGYALGGRSFGDWHRSVVTNYAARQTVLSTNECDYVDSRGRRCALGWWDSPSAEEFHFCDGGPVLPCARWKDGVRVDGATTLGARIQDTCLMVIPDILMMHHYPRLCRETRMSPDIRLPPALGKPERYWPPDDPALAARPRRGRELRVGPGGDFAKPSEAAKAARDGDTVRIAPGTWTGDVCVWPQNDLAIFGAGAEATVLDADGHTAAGKGLWVVQGTNVVVRGVTLRGAACPDRNGAGIRHEADGAFEATDCRFEDNENGFLSGVATNAVLTFRRCVFRDNGAGDGQSHNAYVGRAKKLVFEDCLSDHAREGHALKSRALVTIVDRCLFDDGDDGRSSYLVDCPDGGRVRFYWSRLVQSPVAPNGTMVSVGEESVLPDSSFGKDWTFFENRRASGTEVRSFVPEAKDAWRRDR